MSPSVTRTASVATPWGQSDALRSRKLRPGPGRSASEVARNQRERVHGAMVASVSERGYAASTVEHLVEVSGVSRRTIYDLFGDKQSCFRQTLEALIAAGVAQSLDEGRRELSWEEATRDRFLTAARLIASQPAAARLAIVESRVAGLEAQKPLEEAIASAEGALGAHLDSSPERQGMPRAMVSALVGGAVELCRDRLERGREADLSERIDAYVDVLIGYHPPPEALRGGGRHAAPGEELIAVPDQRDRALRALAVLAAEHGYGAVTVAEVIKRAAISRRTFYAHFSDKDDAMVAALDSAGAQMVAAARPAFQRHPDWAQGLGAAIGALLGFLASRPALAQLVLVETYGAGPEARRHRDQALLPLGSLLTQGLAASPEIGRLVPRTVADCAFALTGKAVREGGAHSLPRLAAVLTYLSLSPFIGAEAACGVANETGQGRRLATRRLESMETLASGSVKRRVATLLSARSASAEGVARETGFSLELVRAQIAELEDDGLVEPVEERSSRGEQLFLSTMRWISDPEWAAISQPRREAISAEIGDLIRSEIELAVRTGTYDGRDDRHLSRVELIVDQQAWRELLDIHDEAVLSSIEVDRRCAERLRGGKRPSFSVRSVQTLFEVPEP